MIWIWIGFIVFVLLMLALDLGVFHRHAHVVKTREALVWSGVWIALALAFNVLIYFAYDGNWQGLGLPSATDPDGLTGSQAAILFFTGYVIEKSLSVDNIFVIALIFSYFAIPAVYQHRVLFWGILGALIMRGVMIAVGAALIARFHWILYIFGAFLILTAGKMLLASHATDPRNNPVVRFARRHLRVTDEFDGQHFFTRVGGALAATPLFLALLVVEFTDLIFAVDSIPAIFAITTDPFLVFTSNVFAILGLRALYFALAGIMDKFHYLKLSLAAILAMIGVKMLLKDILHVIPNISFYTLGLVALILTAGIIASLVRARREAAPSPHF